MTGKFKNINARLINLLLNFKMKNKSESVE